MGDSSGEDTIDGTHVASGTKEGIQMKIPGWIVATVSVVVGALLLYLAATGMNQGPMMGMATGMNFAMVLGMLTFTLLVGALVVGIIVIFVAVLKSQGNKCERCHLRIHSAWHTCPYCGSPISKRP